MKTLQSSPVVPLAVVGADLDIPLCLMLTEGDKVMVEINGARLPAMQDCPLVGRVWTVVSNNPQQTRLRPTLENKLVLTNTAFPYYKDITLHYVNLLRLSRGQPAVFEERDTNLSMDRNGHALSAYILLQMVSHYVPSKQVSTHFPQPDNFLELIQDERLKRCILESWIATIRNDLKSTSWGHRGYFRFALHAGISPGTVRAFQAGDSAVINGLDDQTLVKMFRAFHWMPKFLEQSKGFVPGETREPRADRYVEKK